MELVLFGEVYSKKNSKQIILTKGKRRMIIPSGRYLKSEQNFLWQLMQSDCRHVWRQMSKDKQYPLKVSFYIYRSTNRKFDYINIIQGLCDQLVKMRYLPDDSMNYIIPVFEGWEKDKDKPRVIIKTIN